MSMFESGTTQEQKNKSLSYLSFLIAVFCFIGLLWIVNELQKNTKEGVPPGWKIECIEENPCNATVSRNIYFCTQLLGEELVHYDLNRQADACAITCIGQKARVSRSYMKQDCQKAGLVWRDYRASSLLRSQEWGKNLESFE